jgi:hypothetical protein
VLQTQRTDRRWKQIFFRCALTMRIFLLNTDAMLVPGTYLQYVRVRVATSALLIARRRDGHCVVLISRSIENFRHQDTCTVHVYQLLFPSRQSRTMNGHGFEPATNAEPFLKGRVEGILYAEVTKDQRYM